LLADQPWQYRIVSARVKEVVNAAKANGCAIRIGVNAGSLEKDLLEKYGEPCPEALIESALDHIKLLQDHDFHEYKVAVKASRRLSGGRGLYAALLMLLTARCILELPRQAALLAAP
jgi:4-hydroxy-3-methylbut-2-en-1-yl diphosphate synthase IspG/GcpE